MQPSMVNQQQEEIQVDQEQPGPNEQIDLFKLVSLTTSNREVGNIKAEPELKLMLLRFWTLMDSLENSNYMVSKMTMW